VAGLGLAGVRYARDSVSNLTAGNTHGNPVPTGADRPVPRVV
jgi:hypothetical protein